MNTVDRAAAHAGARLVSMAWLAASFLWSTAAGAAAPDAVPAEFHGTWVPARASCASPAQVQVTADRLTLVNGRDTQSLGGIEMAGPGYFGPSYGGIMAVLLTESSGQQPATATFNVGERRGTAQVDFAPVMPGRATPQLTQYNARITQLNLAKRFPLNKAALKRCGAARK